MPTSRKLIVACVCVGDKYGTEYVERLRRGVARNLSYPHSFVCISDRSRPGIDCIDAEGLQGWWAKMMLFRSDWRKDADVIYVDLDTVIVNRIDVLHGAAMSFRFSICRNFAREYGSLQWPCHYGSCVMTLRSDLSESVWNNYIFRKDYVEKRNERYGDQKAIEEIYGPNARILQDFLPKGFFLNYRSLSPTRPSLTNPSMVIFGGRNKPDNAPEWVQEAWMS